jgi:hypothetical protein
MELHMSLALKQQVLTDWVKSNRVPNALCVTLTEKQFVNGIQLDGIRSDQNFRHFLNLLNRKVYKSAFTRFKRSLNIITVKEVSSAGRHHRHCMLEKPIHISLEDFSDLIQHCWTSTDFGYEHIHITEPYHEDGWYNYILKTRTKTDLLTSIDWNNTYVPNH